VVGGPRRGRRGDDARCVRRCRGGVRHRDAGDVAQRPACGDSGRGNDGRGRRDARCGRAPARSRASLRADGRIGAAAHALAPEGRSARAPRRNGGRALRRTRIRRRSSCTPSRAADAVRRDRRRRRLHRRGGRAPSDRGCGRPTGRVGDRRRTEVPSEGPRGARGRRACGDGRRTAGRPPHDRGERPARGDRDGRRRFGCARGDRRGSGPQLADDRRACPCARVDAVEDSCGAARGGSSRRDGRDPRDAGRPRPR
jgi:hypothetical protein